MHIAFSLMVAAARGEPRPPPRCSRMLWSAYPLMVFFVIVATGNHYWFDAAAGAAVAGLGGGRRPPARAAAARAPGRGAARRA